MVVAVVYSFRISMKGPPESCAVQPAVSYLKPLGPPRVKTSLSILGSLASCCPGGTLPALPYC